MVLTRVEDERVMKKKIKKERSNKSTRRKKVDRAERDRRDRRQEGKQAGMKAGTYKKNQAGIQSGGYLIFLFHEHAIIILYSRLLMRTILFSRRQKRMRK